MDTVPSRQDGFFSTMIIVEMLPKELAFSGVVISDDLVARRDRKISLQRNARSGLFAREALALNA
jgi:hypothetical protein